MKTRYYFLFPVAALLGASVTCAANALKIKEAPRSVMQSTSHAQPAAVGKKTSPPVVSQGKPGAATPSNTKPKPPGGPNEGLPVEKIEKPPQVVKPPKTPKPPPPKATDPDLYFPPIKDNPAGSVNVPEPDTVALFVTALGLLLISRRWSRRARSTV